MTSGKYPATNLNRSHSISQRVGAAKDNLPIAILVGLLTMTGFIHWYLPIGHPMMMPGELTGGLLVIPHNMLHLLFNLNGVGYFILVTIVAGWLPFRAQHKRNLYVIVASYATLTILAWFVLSDPMERGGLDYVDKGIEALIAMLALCMAH